MQDLDTFDLEDSAFPDIVTDFAPSTDAGLSSLGDTISIGGDINGDGLPDSITLTADTDHDGVEDSLMVFADVTGDGVYDVYAEGIDINADGGLDSVTTYIDSDGDGVFDVTINTYDSDNDGWLDTMKVREDWTGDGKPDFEEITSITPTFMEMPIGEPVAPSFYVAGTYADELAHFSPAPSYPENISGDPASSMQCWEYQGNTNRCALYSQKFVIEELTGQDINMEQFADYAEAQGWFTEEDGTLPLCMDKMLDAYGIENEVSFHKEIGDIESCLQQGGRVIVSLDADQIWYGDDSNIFDPECAANHAVEVIGIDRSKPDNPYIVLNDSGSLTGQGCMVPLDVFEDAWESGNNHMISCYPA